MAKKQPQNRNSAGRFTAGHSGNPGGRPKADPEAKAILKAATPAAAALLAGILKDENARPDLRIECAKTVLDRVYGKATQPIDGNIDNHIEIVMSDAVRDLMG